VVIGARAFAEETQEKRNQEGRAARAGAYAHAYAGEEGPRLHRSGA
jgi:hypothetical protein